MRKPTMGTQFNNSLFPKHLGAIAVALSSDVQTGTADCGKQVTVTNSGNGLQGSQIKGSSAGKQIKATVQDTCPSGQCDSNHIGK